MAKPPLHWWHLSALVFLISAAEIGRQIIGGLGWWESLALLPAALYSMGPLMAGVAISILEGDRQTSREAIRLGLVVVAGMLVMDLLSPSVGVRQRLTAARIGADVTQVVDDRGAIDESWIDVLRSWSEGTIELGDGFAHTERRVADPGRNRVAEALGKASLILLVFGVMGMVMAAGRWIRTHVTFDRPQDKRAAHIVVAWLLAPMVVSISARWARGQVHRVNFEGASVWWMTFPFVVVFLLGAIAWNVDFDHPDPRESDVP